MGFTKNDTKTAATIIEMIVAMSPDKTHFEQEEINISPDLTLYCDITVTVVSSFECSGDYQTAPSSGRDITLNIDNAILEDSDGEDLSITKKQVSNINSIL
jgi:hypothetical protein